MLLTGTPLTLEYRGYKQFRMQFVSGWDILNFGRWLQISVLEIS